MRSGQMQFLGIHLLKVGFMFNTIRKRRASYVF